MFDCDKCGSPDKGGGIGGWSVNTKLWNKTMFENGYIKKNSRGHAKGMICIDCFEEMLGRKINKNEFTNTLDNKTNKIIQKYYL